MLFFFVYLKQYAILLTSGKKACSIFLMFLKRW
jgi:hypothetical protein